MFIITGGGSGIGRELALALVARNKKVLIVGRRKNFLEETAAHSPLISFLSLDISTATGRQNLVDYCNSLTSIAGLIHNAALIEPIIPLSEIQESDWQQMLMTNVHAPLFLSQKLLPKLQQGRVLHIGSGAAYWPVKGWGGYCVSKAALSMLTRCWQTEQSNVYFASVMPGIIDTEMQSIIRQTKHMNEEKQAFFQSLKAKNHLLQPATVALFLTWLLLDVPPENYMAQEWDIYEKSHHVSWLQPPHVVPVWE